MAASGGSITHLLAQSGQGDRQAQDVLFRRVEVELREAAERCLSSERAGGSIEPTVLIDEVFVNLVVRPNEIQWHDRAHFYRTAARAMRHFLVDCARRRGRRKRGGDVPEISLDLTQVPSGDAEPLDMLTLDETLDRLEQSDPRPAQVVELHFFGGHTLKQTAEILEVSLSTIKNDWAFARAWLHRELTG